MPLYESGPAVKLGTSHDFDPGQASRTLGSWTGSSSAHLSMAFSVRKDKVGWEAVPAAQFDRGSSSDQRHSGACRGKGFVLSQDMPDGFGELAGNVDPGNFGAALATQAFLVPLVAIPIVDITGGVGGSLHQGPAQVLRPVLGQRSAEVAVARLAHDRAEARIASELLRTREAADIADLGRDCVGEKRADAGHGQQQRDVGVVGTETGELTSAIVDALVELVEHGQAGGQRGGPGLGQLKTGEQ